MDGPAQTHTAAVHSSPMPRCGRLSNQGWHMHMCRPLLRARDMTCGIKSSLRTASQGHKSTRFEVTACCGGLNAGTAAFVTPTGVEAAPSTGHQQKGFWLGANGCSSACSSAAQENQTLDARIAALLPVPWMANYRQFWVAGGPLHAAGAPAAAAGHFAHSQRVSVGGSGSCNEMMMSR